MPASPRPFHGFAGTVRFPRNCLTVPDSWPDGSSDSSGWK